VCNYYKNNPISLSSPSSHFRQNLEAELHISQGRNNPPPPTSIANKKCDISSSGNIQDL
jgi:hypothetical protein